MGPVVTLNRSLIVPFLQFSPNRALREKAYEAWGARGEWRRDGQPGDCGEILALRAERAQLLGYADFAAFKLEPEMAKTPAAVRDLSDAGLGTGAGQGAGDAAVLEAMLQADGFAGPLEPWDWRYYSEKRRKAEHDLDEAALKPYLSLEAMLGAMFDCANRLFGLEFREIEGPFYHPDVRGWEVTRGKGVSMSRCSWATISRGDRSGRAPGVRRCGRSASWAAISGPIVVNVCNFAKGDPCLLSYDDARTLFHEFGHALHQMLSDVTYGFISGTSVARDFVELPSQLYEHWLEVPEVLEAHARHHQTGEPMPADMLQRLLAAGPMTRALPRWSSCPARWWIWSSTPARRPPTRCRNRPRCWKPGDAAGDPDAPRDAAFRACVQRRRLFQRLLQLHVVRGDGCRCLRRLRGGGRSVRSGQPRRGWRRSSCRRAGPRMPRRCI
jgi:peptidyl-dipeptidase Dcp